MKKNICIFILGLFSLCIFAQGKIGENIIEKKQVLGQGGGESHLQLVAFYETPEFIIGEDSENYNGTRKVAPFAINKFETSYGLWYSVKNQAEKKGYKFNNPGQGGNGGKRGGKPNDFNNSQPVTMINWYDAIVWCNAYSEITGRTPCYTFEGKVLRDSTDTASCDLCECNWQANGFRLPSEAEWEFAARFTGKDFQPSNLISGQLSEKNESGLLYAWTCENASGSRIIGTAGTAFDPNGISQMATGNPNLAGLYDMSGNLLEYCWDWYGEYKDDQPLGPKVGDERVSRGGSWSPYTMFVYPGDRYSFDPNVCYDYMGFRIACSLPN